MRDMMAQIRDCGDGIRDGTYTMTAPKITGGTITGAAFTGNTFTSPVISGGSINNTPIGATTANTGRFSDLTDTGLTSGRVIYASTGGNLVDDADFTFNGTTVTMANDASISGLTVGKGGGAVSNNTVVGLNAGVANTTGKITAIGYLASRFNTTGSGNTAVGGNDGAQDGALYLNTTGNYNIAMGTGAVASNTTGSRNTGIGYSALQNNTTASNNTAVGYQAGYSNTTGTSIEAYGYQALYSNTTGQYNSAFGYQSLYSNSTGTQNGAFARGALYSNTTGGYNNAFGLSALGSNTTGSYNSAFGTQALNSNTTASNNTAVGYQALYTTTTGSGRNTAVGNFAGQSLTTGSQCTFIGDYAGQLTTGSSNTFVGRPAGYLVTTGANNTIIGAYSGNQGGLDIRTANNYIVLSDGDGNPRVIHDGTALIVASSTTSAYSNRAFQVNGAFNNSPLVTVQYTSSGGTPQIAQLYMSAQAPNNTSSVFLECSDNAANRVLLRSNGGIANYSGNNVNLSDIREKTNIELAGSYLDKICAIPVKTFNYIDQNREEDDGLTLGVIAQDVQAVAPEFVMESDWSAEKDGSKMRLSIYQTDLQYALMKCIQELKAEVDSLKAQLNK